jgi:competence protein ComEC
MKKLFVFLLITLFLITASLAISCSKNAPVTAPSVTTSTVTTKTTTSTSTTTTTGKLDVYFIDVGQGDAILLDQGTTEVLIDAGSSSLGVTSFLQQYVDGPLEVMVATHAHADHIGGLTAVLNTFEVGEIWHSGDTSTSKTYATFMAAVNGERATVHIGKRGDTINAGSLLFTVLSPVSLDGTSNNNSLVISLSYGDIDFLFTGDAEQEAGASMLTAGLLSDLDILKVGHHGSRTASSPVFLATIKPELAIYMAAIGNTYRHPHQETLTNLSNIGAMVCGTDVNGTIRVETDGHTYSTQIEKAGTPKAGS